MIFGNRRRKEIHAQIGQFCGLVGTTVEQFASIVNHYLDGDTHFKEETREISETETQADAIRKDVERQMYEGAFLPAYREDYIDLLETLDNVANRAEDACQLIWLVRPEIPPELSEDLRQLARLTVDAYTSVPDLVKRVLEGDFEVQQEVAAISLLEAQIDGIELRATRRVFKELDLEKADKLLLMKLMEELAEVSDCIKKVGSRLNIIAIKRQMA